MIFVQAPFLKRIKSTFLLLDKIREMIKMLGGDDNVRDISEGILILENLIKERTGRPQQPRQNFQPKHERKYENKTETEE